MFVCDIVFRIPLDYLVDVLIPKLAVVSYCRCAILTQFESLLLYNDIVLV